MSVGILVGRVAFASIDPIEGEIILPLPNGESLRFAPVCVTEGDKIFHWKTIKLGDPSGGFKEYPTSMAIGGSFPLKDSSGKTLWCYYMARTEITKSQYDALMKKDDSNAKENDYPVTNISWFEAMRFLDRYNRWLFAHHKEKLPKFDTAYGYLRLPTEAEWEFAARGGSVVDRDFFDRKIPYPVKKLQEYEWFGGPTSSHYKLQKVGRLKPNPLGLHDMLGNADEMTMSLFQVEYYQGRTGGFVIKGNNYITAKKKLRSSFRTEQPFYRMKKDGTFEAQKKKTLGFRPVIASLAIPSRTIQHKMHEEWESYRAELGAKTPAVLSTATTGSQSAAVGEDAFVYITRLKEQLRKGVKDPSKLNETLGYLESSVQKLAAIRTKAEEDAAYLWVKVAGEQARFIRKEAHKLPLLDKLIALAKSGNDPKKVQMYENRKKEHLENIERSLSTYSDSIRQMATISEKAMEKGFGTYLAFLTKHHDAEQVALLNRIRKHYDAYRKMKRVDIKMWKQSILE